METRRDGSSGGRGSAGRPDMAFNMSLESGAGLSRIPASLSSASAGLHSGSALMSSLASDGSSLNTVSSQRLSRASSGLHSGSALMSSLASDGSSLNTVSSQQSSNTPDIVNTHGMRSVDLEAGDKKCFKLIDEREELQVKNAEEMLQRMGCVNDKNLFIKVVSIFGNTGEGKSHTLNQIFFNGTEVFKTSANQTSCTLGVWGAYDPSTKALVLDTEGMLGISNISRQRKRLLLKVLAISDIIIYRTRAERLNTDMYKFLAEASRAYTKYFRADLEAVVRKAECSCILGPPVYIFHDTRHTNVLAEERGQKPEEILKENFTKQDMSIDAFNSLNYIGERNDGCDTDFSKIKKAVFDELTNMNVRSPRQPKIILDMLDTINKKFNGEIPSSELAFPDEYFTCTSVCEACQARCCLFMNHSEHHDGSKHHKAKRQCKYHHQFDNKMFLCLKCDHEGEQRLVVPKTSSARDSTWLGLAKFAWSGYVLECEKCGIIYRSRQYWYGNEFPDRSVVKEEFQHVWQGCVLGSSAHAGRQVLEGMAALGSAISTISSPPAKVVSAWLTNQVNPGYWKANHLCTVCKLCHRTLETIHHCRKCGEGFCDPCSEDKLAVPERGWGEEPVRVCKTCFMARNNNDRTNDAQEVRARQVTEVISGTLATVAKYPLDFLKDSTRPSYWVADDLISQCVVCEAKFGPRLPLHHCRACGQGVCSPCSSKLRSVKERGWDHPVRVCDNCVK